MPGLPDASLALIKCVCQAPPHRQYAPLEWPSPQLTLILLHLDTKPKPKPYDYGSRGPAELDDFMAANAGYKRSDKPYTSVFVFPFPSTQPRLNPKLALYSWPSTSVL